MSQSVVTYSLLGNGLVCSARSGIAVVRTHENAEYWIVQISLNFLFV